jgi:hypothetical protein
MAFEFDWEKVDGAEIIQSLSAIVTAPVILPVAAAVKQPLVKAAIKEGITLSERCKETVAEAVEEIENIVAQVNAELVAQKQASFLPEATPKSTTNGRSEIAKDFMNVVQDLNNDVVKISNGALDLRLLLPVGLGTLAIAQLLKKGLQIEEIPWYVLAWYAFDTFVKFNVKDESPFKEG